MTPRLLKLSLFAVALAGLAGCGQRAVTCDCSDGSTQRSSQSSNACIQCPDACKSHGGWSGGYAYDQGPADAGPFDVGECGTSSGSSGSSTSGGSTSSSGSGSGSTSGGSSGSTGASSSGSSSGSSGSGGSASVSGLPGFSVADQTGATYGAPDGGHDLSYVEVDLTDVDHGDLCTLTKPASSPGELALVVDVERAPGQDVVPGTYSTGASQADGGKGEVIEMIAADGGSADVVGFGTGSVTFTTVDLAGSAGSFDVTFTLPDAGSEAVQGTFSGVPLCHSI